MSYNYISGNTIRFYTSTPFTSITGTIVDPDVVKFQYSVQGQTTHTFTYTNGSGDPTNTIVRVSTGNYYADISTTGTPGTWTWGWSGQPNGGADTTRTAAVWEGTVIISAPSF